MVVAAMVLFSVSRLNVRADYDNYPLYTIQYVNDTDTIVDLMEQVDTAFMQSANGDYVNDVLKHFLFESEYAPFSEESQVFPDDWMDSFEDNKYYAEFNESKECAAYSYYIASVIYGIPKGEYKKPESYLPEDLKTFFQKYVQPGEHFRWANQHSGTFIAYSDEGIYYLNRILDGKIALSYYSYDDMSNFIYEKDLELWVYDVCKAENQNLEELKKEQISNMSNEIVSSVKQAFNIITNKNQQDENVDLRGETVAESKNADDTTTKEYNYSYYCYYVNGTKYYTWSRDYAIKQGGTGERVYRGWGRELMLYTNYDGVWGSKYVDNGIWFYEEIREKE